MNEKRDLVVEELTFVPLAVCADLVGFKLEQALDRNLILGSPLCGRVGRSSRHGGGGLLDVTTGADVLDRE